MRGARIALCGVLAGLLLSGCGGWHLRGTGDDSAVGYRVYVKHAGANIVAAAVKRELRNRGALLVQERADAHVILEIIGQQYDRRILSVDPDTGKVREIELGLASEFSIRAADGRLLFPREQVSWDIDYIFDESSVLGTTEQDSVVRRDLAEIAATSMVLKMQSIDLASLNTDSP